MRILSIGECMVEMAESGDGLYRKGVAGDTLNTAWYLRALAPEDWQVSYFTMLGTDTTSDGIEAFIAGAGIGIDWIGRHPTRAPGLYLISLKNGERSFTYWRDTSAARTLADDPAHLRAACDAADVIYLSGITLAILPPDRREALLETLRGRRVVFDPNIRPRLWETPQAMRNAVEAAAALSDIVLPSFEDEAEWFGDATPEQTAERCLALGAQEVVVKNGGSQMAFGQQGHGVRLLPPMPRVTPTDTTGAGDSFNAGYLVARLSGATPEAAVEKGHALAARVVMSPGALMPQNLLRGAAEA